jgi:hypothetical protein
MGEYDWLIGAALNVVGSLAINFGTNLLKYSHLRAERAYMESLARGGEGSAVKRSPDLNQQLTQVIEIATTENDAKNSTSVKVEKTLSDVELVERVRFKSCLSYREN